VRELENVLRDAVRAEREIIFSWDLPPGLRGPAPSREESAQPAERGPRAKVPMTMDEVEKEKIREALEATRGNITRAGEILGFRSRQTMLNKMDRLGIPRNYGDPEAIAKLHESKAK
jgi:DNA-binding NtrC family response regulator